MKRLTTLTGKNLPKLSVAKPGWPVTADIIAYVEEEMKFARKWTTEKAVHDFTRVCDQTGLSERLRKD